MNCPGCDAEIKYAVSVGEHPAEGAEGLCARCGSFVHVTTTNVRLMTEDEIAALNDDKRNLFLRLRRRIHEVREGGDPSVDALASTVCAQCGPMKVRMSYVLRHIQQQTNPPCPRCGARLRPDLSALGL